MDIKLLKHNNGGISFANNMEVPEDMLEQMRDMSSPMAMTMGGQEPSEEDMERAAELELLEEEMRGNTDITELVIPDQIDGVDVKRIEAKGFKNSRNLISVEMPDSITDIGYESFAHCSRLKTVKLSKSLTKIGDNAFTACTELESFEIPEGVEEIGDFAMLVCDSITEVKLPDSCHTIGISAIRGKSITSIDLNKVVTLKQNALFVNTAINELVVPSTVESIAANVFYGWTEDQKIIFEDYSKIKFDTLAFNGCKAEIVK